VQSWYGEFLAKKLKFVEVEIAAFERVPPTKTKGVQISVNPSGATVQLEVVRTFGTAGSGSVYPTSITGTATVTVTGGSQTSVGHADNMSLRAKAAGCVCDSEAFTVCAHPEDFETDRCDALREPSFSTYYGLEVFYEWASDSGSTSHLDECYLEESFSGAYGDTPPFYDVGTPTATAESMNGGTTGDEQGWKKSKVYNYVDGTAGWDQELKFECKRCGKTDTLSNNSTTFTVYDDPANDWWITTEVSTSCPGPAWPCEVSANIP